MVGDQVWTDGFWQGGWIWESTGNRSAWFSSPTLPNNREVFLLSRILFVVRINFTLNRAREIFIHGNAVVKLQAEVIGN